MVLEGKLTLLRSIRKSDLKHIETWINDVEVQYYAQEEYPFYFAPWLVKNMYDDGIKGKKLIYIIEDKFKNVIGELWLYPVDYIKRASELVITIGKKDLRGKGYGRDAINTAKNYCFESLKLESIYLKVFSFNLRAINCYKACGFRIVGKIPNKVIRYGTRFDEYIMEVKRK